MIPILSSKQFQLYPYPTYVTLQAKTEYDFRPENDSVDRVCVKCKLQYHCKLFLHAPTGPMVNLCNVSEHFKAKNWKKMSHNRRI